MTSARVLTHSAVPRLSFRAACLLLAVLWASPSAAIQAGLHLSAGIQAFYSEFGPFLRKNPKWDLYFSGGLAGFWSKHGAPGLGSIDISLLKQKTDKFRLGPTLALDGLALFLPNANTAESVSDVPWVQHQSSNLISSWWAFAPGLGVEARYALSGRDLLYGRLTAAGTAVTYMWGSLDPDSAVTADTSESGYVTETWSADYRKRVHDRVSVDDFYGIPIHLIIGIQHRYRCFFLGAGAEALLMPAIRKNNFHDRSFFGGFAVFLQGGFRIFGSRSYL